MDRKALREFTHKVDSFLEIGNSNYKQWVFRYTFLELQKDLGIRGDITTGSIFHTPQRVRAQVVAREGGVMAGESELKYFLVEGDANFRPSLKDSFVLDFKVNDGDAFNSGDVLLEIEADVRDLLAVERTILNLLNRMCGVATFTRSIVDLVADCDVMIAPTRKTLWGLLDKKAVLLGGGSSHRIGLFDAIMVKDNHLDLLGRDFDKVFQRIAGSSVESRFVEVEVENVEEVVTCCEAFGRYLGEQIRSVGVVLMDNMNADEVARAILLVKEKGFHGDYLFECSGGISDKNVLEYAKTGVDIISMGSLTDGVKGIDLGLDMLG